jgi:tetratricopeptide (TPR) repeat protein
VPSGQDTIPDIAVTDGVSPLGCTWQRYLEQLTAEHGGWTALTQLLIRRAGPSAGLPEDPGTIERGLRRLRARGNAPGGQYGTWLLRHFGVPRPLEDTARWMGQYHSRFSDLPLQLREAQLLLWDRPPIAESPAAGWVHLGLASVALRRRELDAAGERLDRVGTRVAAARLEAELLRARLAMDRGRSAEAEAVLADLAAPVADLPAGPERDCYHARWADQRAYHLIHAGPVPRLRPAARLYASINARSRAAFALFRREHGLAYCHWRLGDHDRAVRHARAALEHAGDAGHLRFRVLALQLLAHIEPGEAGVLRRRAGRINAELERGT